ncbi:MAG TPA: cytochrome c [Stellaceae bacterium]|nr:cytochrome c [Stellaceae bacterium]
MRFLHKSAAVMILAGTASLAAAHADAASAARGKAMVKQQCAGCHAVEPGGQSPNPKAPTFAAVANEPSATPYSLHVFLQTTHATMPNFMINSDDIDDIVAYILSLKAKP